MANEEVCETRFSALRKTHAGRPGAQGSTQNSSSHGRICCVLRAAHSLCVDGIIQHAHQDAEICGFAARSENF